MPSRYPFKPATNDDRVNSKLIIRDQGRSDNKLVKEQKPIVLSQQCFDYTIFSNANFIWSQYDPYNPAQSYQGLASVPTGSESIDDNINPDDYTPADPPYTSVQHWVNRWDHTQTSDYLIWTVNRNLLFNPELAGCSGNLVDNIPDPCTATYSVSATTGCELIDKNGSVLWSITYVNTLSGNFSVGVVFPFTSSGSTSFGQTITTSDGKGYYLGAISGWRVLDFVSPFDPDFSYGATGGELNVYPKVRMSIIGSALPSALAPGPFL